MEKFYDDLVIINLYVILFWITAEKADIFQILPHKLKQVQEK